jgi:hypothetical protein
MSLHDLVETKRREIISRDSMRRAVRRFAREPVVIGLLHWRDNSWRMLVSKAKPARKIVRARPVKEAKDAV